MEEKELNFLLSIKGEEKLDLAEIFGNDHPVHLEIGSGRGEFLIGKARQNQHINFLGIDLKEKRIRTILRKLDPDRDHNIRLLRIFVDHQLLKHIDKGSFERIYIMHPDPWPKRKHHKNRMIQQEFLQTLAEILKPAGLIDISTDHYEYALWIQKIFATASSFKSLYVQGFSREPDADHVVTHFEEKKIGEGFPPLFMKYKRTEN